MHSVGGFCKESISCTIMDVDSAINAVKEEHMPVKETDDSCILEYFEIVPLTRTTDVSCTTECVGGDLSAEVKQENLAVEKQEHENVCCVSYVMLSLPQQKPFLQIILDSFCCFYIYYLSLL